jgi:hypothetical protein
MANKGGYTEGPWEARKTNDVFCGQGWGVIAVEPMRGRVDSAITGMTEADARLMAAAPEMLATLKSMRSTLLRLGGDPMPTLDAVIAKAEATDAH